MDIEINDIETIINTDYNKELKKVSIFERYNDFSNINNNKCINCNKTSNYICLVDNKYYCWYHALTWKE